MLSTITVKCINIESEPILDADPPPQGVKIPRRNTRYIWLRNPDTLSERQRAILDALPTRTLKTARAYQIRLAF